MIWALMSYDGILEVRWVDERMDSNYYQSNILDRKVLKYEEFNKNYRYHWSFVQDSATSHVSKATLEFLEKYNISLV